MSRIFAKYSAPKGLIIVKQVLKSDYPDQQPRHGRGCRSGSSLFQKCRRSVYSGRWQYPIRAHEKYEP